MVSKYRDYGLSKQAKFLYVFMIENFDETMKTVEYNGYLPKIRGLRKSKDNFADGG